MMVRVFKHYVPMQLVLLALIEGLIFAGALYLGVVLRFATDDPMDLVLVGPIYPRALAYAAIMLAAFTSFGLYTREAPAGYVGLYVRFMGGFLSGLVVMAMFFYVFPDMFLGRGAFGLSYFFSVVGVAGARLVFFRFVDTNILKRRIMVLGAGTRAAGIGKLLKNPNMGHRLHLVGYLPANRGEHSVDKSQMLMDEGPLLAVAKKHAVDEIIVGVRDRRNGALPMQELLECKLEGVEVTDLSTFFERETGRVQLDSLNISWMIFSDGFRRSSYRDTVKRIFDVTVATTLLVLMLPIMIVTAVAILLETGLPIFYRQERVGECGHAFMVLKFRSMRTDAERDGVPKWAQKSDNRVTPVGKFIRTVRIDELPQFLNVLKGDMSFVGPRPERSYFVRQLSKDIPYYPSRHTVKPGITGWAQVRYPYGSSVEDAIEKLQYDLYYAKNHTLFLDLVILFQTIQVVLFGKGAR